MEISTIYNISIPFILYFSDRLVSGILENECYAFYKKVIDKIKNSDQTVTQNLQFAVHNSIIIALNKICLECIDELGEVDEDDIEWLKHKCKILEDDLKKNNPAKYVGYTVKEINEIELSLMSSGILSENIKEQIKVKLINATLIDKETPACYKKKVEENLSEYVCSSLAKLIQDYSDLHKIFNEQLLVDIHRDLQDFNFNMDELLSSLAAMKDRGRIIVVKTTRIEEIVEQIAEKLNIETKIIKVKIISPKYIQKKFKSEQLKYDTYNWLVKGWFTQDDVYSKSKNSFIFYKKYIPVYEYTGSYSGTVLASVVTERGQYGQVIKTDPPVPINFDDERFQERITGVDLSKVLKLKPSELGSLWGVVSNYVKKIPDIIFHSNVFMNKINLPLEKKTFDFLRPIIEDLKRKEYIDMLEKLDLKDNLDISEENDIEIENLDVNLDDFISKIEERYNTAQILKKNRIGHKLRGDVITEIIPKQERLPEVHEIKIIFIPIWIASYLYNGKKFLFVKNLNTLKHGGIRPISKLKNLMPITLLPLTSLLIYNFIKTSVVFYIISAFITIFIPIVILVILEQKRKSNLESELDTNVIIQKNVDIL